MKTDIDEKKTHTMGLRMDDKTFLLLERYSKEWSMNKSKLLKLSFEMWIKMKMAIQEENMILISKALFKQLIEYLPHGKISEFAHLESELILNKFKIHLMDAGLEDSVESFMNLFTSLFGLSGIDWFDSLKYQLHPDNKLTIYIIHALGKEFSIFSRDLLKYLMKSGFNYELISSSESISNTTISLNFKLAD